MASLASSSLSLSSIPLRTLYARLLLTRLVDERLQALYQQGYIDSYSSCRGFEAAQVGTAMCIEVGQDFTLPAFRDLGVALTIGMTPDEALHTCISSCTTHTTTNVLESQKQPIQWSYHKRNVVHGNNSTATHILHAAGIAFASKLRKATAVTIAYCDESVVTEPDFLEGIRFAAQQRLPVVFICEQACSPSKKNLSSSSFETLPEGLTHQRIDGMDAEQVYETMCTCMDRVRAGNGPVLLELAIIPAESDHDPLTRCEQVLRERNLWDEEWASHIRSRFTNEIEQASHNALLDSHPAGQ